MSLHFSLSASAAGRFFSSGCERQLFDACDSSGARFRADPSPQSSAHMARGVAFEAALVASLAAGAAPRVRGLSLLPPLSRLSEPGGVTLRVFGDPAGGARSGDPAVREAAAAAAHAEALAALAALDAEADDEEAAVLAGADWAGGVGVRAWHHMRFRPPPPVELG